MSLALTTTERQRLHAAQPSFIGLVGGELFKITRMASTWISFIITMCFVAAPSILLLLVSNFTDSFSQGIADVSLKNFYQLISIDFLMMRVFIGFFLIILTANVIGREYQQGTVRIILARGVGRVQLLLAKLTAVTLTALLTFVIWLLMLSILILLAPLVKAGNLNALQALTSTFWHDAGTTLLTVLISMGVTILMTAALCAIGRSLSFGLTASALWFPIDNIGILVMLIAFRLTNNDFWNNITAYFLGPNLNLMSSAITANIKSEGFTPNVAVDGTHTLLVALVYAIIFAVVAIMLTWKRDVKE